MNNQELIKLFYAELDLMTPESLKSQLEDEESALEDFWCSDSFAYIVIKDRFNFDFNINHLKSNEILSLYFDKPHLIKTHSDKFSSHFNGLLYDYLELSSIFESQLLNVIEKIEVEVEENNSILGEIKKTFNNHAKKEIEELPRRATDNFFSYINKCKELTNRYSTAA